MVAFAKLWSSDFKPTLALLSYSTGLTIPRFTSPQLIQTQAGVFLLLLPQLVVAFFIILPCIFMELALGQYSGKAVVRIWDLCPPLRGIGLSSFLTFLLYQIYYSFLCASTFCFMLLSYSDESQWQSCNKSWNRVNCFTMEDNYTRRLQCEEKCAKMVWQSSVEQFYLNRVLNADQTRDMGMPPNELFLCAFITGLVVFLANCGGHKSSQKILLLLTIISIVQLVALFVLPLVGKSGLPVMYKLFTKADKARLGDLTTWTEVTKQSISSSGVGFGVYMTLATRADFRQPLHFKAVVASLLTVLFTAICNIILQNYLEWTCAESRMTLDQILSLKSDLPLPDATFFLRNSSKTWMTLWLSNCYTLGLRSLIVMMASNSEILYNSLPKGRNPRLICVLFFCMAINTCGVFLATKHGYQVAQTIEIVVHNYSFVFLNFLQLFGVVYCYGIITFRDDVHFMLGVKPSKLWTTTYLFNPLVLLAVLVYTIHNLYKVTITRPWTYILENVLLWMNLSLVMLYALCFIVTTKRSKESSLLDPNTSWGPREVRLKRSRKMFGAYNITKEYLYRQERFNKQNKL